MVLSRDKSVQWLSGINREHYLIDQEKLYADANPLCILKENEPRIKHSNYNTYVVPEDSVQNCFIFSWCDLPLRAVGVPGFLIDSWSAENK